MSPLVASSTAQATPTPERAALREAAQGFEAIFVRRMLEAARLTNFGADLIGGAGLEQFTTLRNQHLADIAAQRGSFGIAEALEAQLARNMPSSSGAEAG